jgi:hypothetical protein
MWLKATQDFGRSVAAGESCAVEIQPSIESSQSKDQIGLILTRPVT